MLSGFVNYTLFIDLLEKNTLIPLEITMFSFNLSRITCFSQKGDAQPNTSSLILSYKVLL